jgi:MoaA/NifB/PqqE/SkfB family radical SAM enzyme
MTRFSPFTGRSPTSAKIDNTRHWARILYRWRSYSLLVRIMAGRVPLTSLVRTQFPYLLPDAPVPPSISLELTNICNVACTYCTSPLARRPQGMMTESTFNNLVAQLSAARVKRVRIVGNGEPTLHPQFPLFAAKLARAVPFVSIVSNAQRWPDSVLFGILDAPIRLVEVSVDGADAAAYEKSRVNGKFANLLENLSRLRTERSRRSFRPAINIRLMVRPSDAHRETELEKFWRPHADSVMKQYVIRRKEIEGDTDAYQNVQRASNEYPRCTLPFKDLCVTWDGNVPLCQFSAMQTGAEPGLLLGNLNTTTISRLWNAPLMKQYREAHRTRQPEKMRICAGCTAV